MYVPSMWHHAVLNLCDTVAVSDSTQIDTLDSDRHAIGLICECRLTVIFTIGNIRICLFGRTTNDGEHYCFDQVTQNYCSRTNLRRCYAMATGLNLSECVTSANPSAHGEDARGYGVLNSRSAAGLCPEVQRQWREAMVKRHPDMAAAHMPHEWLQEELVSGDDY